MAFSFYKRVYHPPAIHPSNYLKEFEIQLSHFASLKKLFSNAADEQPPEAPQKTTDAISDFSQWTGDGLFLDSNNIFCVVAIVIHKTTEGLNFS